jgi:hypothetical protein
VGGTPTLLETRAGRPCPSYEVAYFLPNNQSRITNNSLPLSHFVGDEILDEVVHFVFVGVELADELELVAGAVEVVVGALGGEVLVA